MKTLWGKTAVVLGTGFGFGLSPIVPGTVGSLLGPPLVWLMRFPEFPPAIYGVFVLLIIIVGVPICGKAADHFGREDPGQVVWDEIAAFPLVFFMIPLTWEIAILGFFWFRVFDMTKPWPIRKLEKFHGGLGIMLDDLAAAVPAWLALQGTIKLFNIS